MTTPHRRKTIPESTTSLLQPHHDHPVLYSDHQIVESAGSAPAAPDIPDVVIVGKHQNPDQALTGDESVVESVTNTATEEESSSAKKKKKKQPKKPQKTRVVMLSYKQREKFDNNNVNTSKYSIFTFLPYFLYEQFRRASNIFFLAMALLQQIDDVSPTGRYTTAMPLAVIVMVSAIKEIIEDVKRHKADDNTNNQIVEVLKGDNFEPTKWKDVVVGDLVRLENEAFVPADLVVFSTSEALGMCYIETANLDGETNLKLRQALPKTATIQEAQDFLNVKGYIECGVPNRMIYDFAGSLHLESEKDILSLGPDQLVLRGAKLRNTKWIIGQAIYTGHDTKLMKNSTKAPLKRSTLDKATNVQIALLFVALIIISAISAIFFTEFPPPDYIGAKELTEMQEFLQFLTFLLLYNNLIPISLSVTLECVRYMQALFINWDADLYHVESNTAAQARTSNLNEELGQIRYIFSDKTGTLTRNVMEFKGCTVGGVLYPYEDLFPNSAKGSVMLDTVEANPLIQSIKKGNVAAEEFLVALAVCHYVIPEVKKGADGVEQTVYNAASPDEKALVEGAQRFGYMFVSRSPSTVEISVQGKSRYYQVLNLIEFTSTRKRMTVILRCPDGKIRLYCKGLKYLFNSYVFCLILGADSVILETIATKSQTEEEDLQTTKEHLDFFAASGLRTLCVGIKILSEEEHKKWDVDFQVAVNSVIDRDEEVNKAAELIENNLTLVGSTAIEDKLQDLVPDTIASFLEAGISVWVLTGDKQETAINIGNSCRLITPSMTVFIINQNNEEDTLECIQAFANELQIDLEAMNGQGKKAYRNIIPHNAAVVIDGHTLSFALEDRVRHSFLSLCCSCLAVIVCRAAPMQKAEIVEYVTKLTGAVTLAIGDGANDVAMIQKAHVGVGISGNEGLQAACASDYAIAQFYYLKKLLFVHGAWNHDRITKAIFYSFYKNICLYIIELWFAIYSAWSGQILFDRWAITTYNLIFVCMQPLVIGIFEQNCSMENRMLYPLLYHATSHGAFSVKNFSIWMMCAMLHSICLFWITKEYFADSSVWENGKEGSYLILGNSIYTYVVIVVSLKLGLATRAWTKFTHISIWGSILLWFIFLVAYSFMWPITIDIGIGNEMYDIVEQLFISPMFWLCLFFIPAVTLIPDLIYSSVMGSIFGAMGPDVLNIEEEERQSPLPADGTIEDSTKLETVPPPSETVTTAPSKASHVSATVKKIRFRFS
ncbi:phospholipid-transporting ATPase IB [Folsomia candida]|uniref:phospholipid-transporting ATPase IB n=1 Tax=Folsomia candida TaxID=158441 RepID=UPI001604C1DC|nr:phospholipid-transporting ATPase IB [Folsomia candida]